MNLADFDYDLPQELIAHFPTTPRDHSRLLVLNRSTSKISHHHFYDLPNLLTKNDVLVFNQTKVFPARLHGTKDSGGKMQILLLKKLTKDLWHALCKPGLKLNQRLIFGGIPATVTQVSPDGSVEIKFIGLTQAKINLLGQTPLPPYIHSPLSQTSLKHKYQTTYAKNIGSAAAPTAGLHFTKKLLQELKQKGIQQEFVTLHVGLGTFKPPTAEQLNQGVLHTEDFYLGEDTTARLNQAKAAGKRLIAVGTTTTRVLESCTNDSGVLIPQNASTDIFIKPTYKFKFVDALITNFHLPQSSLLMLVSAFISYPNTKHKFTNFLSSSSGQVYLQAINNKYRFFSFGDAMFIH